MNTNLHEYQQVANRDPITSRVSGCSFLNRSIREHSSYSWSATPVFGFNIRGIREIRGFTPVLGAKRGKMGAGGAFWGCFGVFWLGMGGLGLDCS